MQKGREEKEEGKVRKKVPARKFKVWRLFLGKVETPPPPKVISIYLLQEKKNEVEVRLRLGW